jgi:hypothetical protein
VDFQRDGRSGNLTIYFIIWISKIQMIKWLVP